jgi:hypothetical protein
MRGIPVRSYAEPGVLPLSIYKVALDSDDEETAVQLLKRYQDLACDNRSVSPETCESHVVVIART